MAHIPEQLRRQVAERAGHRCEYCHSNELFTGGPFHVEHVMPTARGGATEMDNLAYACARCNLQKGLRIYAVDPVSRRSAPLFNPRHGSTAGPSISTGATMAHGSLAEHAPGAVRLLL